MVSCLFGDFKILEIFSASLKNLILDTGDFSEPNSDGLANCEIKVACPSLVSFYFLTASTWNFTFQDLNSLQAGFASYYFLPKHATAEECHNVMSKILIGLRNVQVLKLSVGFLRFLKRAVAKSKWFSTSFYNLKSLSLYVLLKGYKQVEPIINLLNLYPNLEALTILFDWMDWSECWEITDEVTCYAYHLKSVRLLDFGGSENELELLMFLLMKGKVQEKLSITWLEGVETHREIIREIKKFPTSSSIVAFTFLEPRSNAGFVSYYFLPKHATAEECHTVMSKILEGLRNVQVLKLSMDFLRLDWSECWEIPDEVTCSAYHLKSARLLDFGVVRTNLNC
ncbi:hypothetical protein LWI28_019984 [Acer negundo]|uniref:FBD domain-containing protein n=1 Tax=Acer negundo TaxID=4023 RepID=A0AAD5J6Z8_ACENE|nr:hypothetical protein LWI28_019984 [Acer negundo]